MAGGLLLRRLDQGKWFPEKSVSRAPDHGWVGQLQTHKDHSEAVTWGPPQAASTHVSGPPACESRNLKSSGGRHRMGKRVIAELPAMPAPAFIITWHPAQLETSFRKGTHFSFTEN